MAWELVILQGGEETLHQRSPVETEAEAQEWLDIKAASHESKGWLVVREPRAVQITKTYIEGPVASKARRLFIREI